jgi:phospholipase/lecithinase/hemolysin
MRHYKFVLSLIAAAALVGCGGGSGSSSTGTAQAVRGQFSSLITFGDSLSDVGTYKVGTVANLRGGTFTINGVGSGALTGKNYTQLLAAQLNLPPPCPNQTGLIGDPALGFSVPVVTRRECTNYAQGGARVFDPKGSGFGSPLGPLTVPVAKQIQNHLAANGGRFAPDALLLLLAGGNDVFESLGVIGAGAAAAGEAAGAAEGARVGAMVFGSTLTQSLAATASNPAAAAQAIGVALASESARPGSTSETIVGVAVAAAATQPGNAAVGSPAVFGPLVAAAQSAAATAGAAAGARVGAAAGAAFFTATAPSSVAAMGRLGAAYGNLIKTEIVAKGANFVTVITVPPAQLTPDALLASPEEREFIRLLVVAFNTQLAEVIASEPKILLIDSFTANLAQAADPKLFGVSNTTLRACDRNPARNILDGSSLVCTTSNLITAPDIEHFAFADSSHPTPYGYLLLARLVSTGLIIKGWL